MSVVGILTSKASEALDGLSRLMQTFKSRRWATKKNAIIAWEMSLIAISIVLAALLCRLLPAPERKLSLIQVPLSDFLSWMPRAFTDILYRILKAIDGFVRLILRPFKFLKLGKLADLFKFVFYLPVRLGRFLWQPFGRFFAFLKLKIGFGWLHKLAIPFRWFYAKLKSIDLGRLAIPFKLLWGGILRLYWILVKPFEWLHSLFTHLDWLFKPFRFVLDFFLFIGLSLLNLGRFAWHFCLNLKAYLVRLTLLKRLLRIIRIPLDIVLYLANIVVLIVAEVIHFFYWIFARIAFVFSSIVIAIKKIKLPNLRLKEIYLWLVAHVPRIGRLGVLKNLFIKLFMFPIELIKILFGFFTFVLLSFVNFFKLLFDVIRYRLFVLESLKLIWLRLVSLWYGIQIVCFKLLCLLMRLLPIRIIMPIISIPGKVLQWIYSFVVFFFASLFKLLLAMMKAFSLSGIIDWWDNLCVPDETYCGEMMRKEFNQLHQQMAAIEKLLEEMNNQGKQ